MPSRFAAALASILSPIMRICSELGPMKIMPCSSTISAKAAFSDRKPTPGWIASAPAATAASRPSLVDVEIGFPAGGGPTLTASSAIRTASMSVSASECACTTSHAQRARRAVDAHRDLAAVGDEQFPDGFRGSVGQSSSSAMDGAGHHRLLVFTDGKAEMIVPAASAFTSWKVFITSTRPIVSPTATVSPSSTEGRLVGRGLAIERAGQRRLDFLCHDLRLPCCSDRCAESGVGARRSGGDGAQIAAGPAMR
jgi:hypothetical protein